jgi:hypothetical protein
MEAIINPNKFISILILSCFLCLGVKTIKASAGALEIDTQGDIKGSYEAPWDYPQFGFGPHPWNNKELSLDKRISVMKYVTSRLEFTKNTFPLLEKRISIKGEKLNINDIMQLIGKELGSNIPVIFKCDSNIRHTFKIEDYPVYEIIEAFCLGSGFDPVYKNNVLEIHNRT